MKRSFFILTMIIVLISGGILAGCEDFDFDGCDCEDEIDDLIAARGQPDDKEETFENGVHTLTYWYHDSGYSQTFKWGEGTDLCCETNYSTRDNQAPIAQNQSVFTEAGVSVEITLSASDIDGDDLVYQIVTSPTQGSLSGVAPDLVYIPNSGFVGSDSFTFIASDGRMDSLAATVQITVTPASNDDQNDDQTADPAQ